MKQVALYLFFFISCSLSATTYFVSPTGVPNLAGSSWDTATTLADALALAKAGDLVYVMQGAYVPHGPTGRSFSFTVPAGVEMYGGFQGHENTPAERVAGAKSILDGNIGDPSTDADNVYTVVTLSAGKGTSSLLDGFVITGGTARSFTKGFTSNNAGGGLYVEDRADVLSEHLIINCDFLSNKGHNGAAVFVDGGNTSFENCRFTNNRADFKGGAVYNMAAGKRLNIRFLDCQFQENAAKYGGAMANNGENGVAVPLLIGCGFQHNVAKSNGAAVYNMTNETGDCNIITETCFFNDNTSILGDEVATKGAKKSLAQLREESNNIGVIISGSAPAKK